MILAFEFALEETVEVDLRRLMHSYNIPVPAGPMFDAQAENWNEYAVRFNAADDDDDRQMIAILLTNLIDNLGLFGHIDINAAGYLSVYVQKSLSDRA